MVHYPVETKYSSGLERLLLKYQGSSVKKKIGDFFENTN